MLLKNFSYGLVSLFLKNNSNRNEKYLKGTKGQNVGISNGTSMARTSLGFIIDTIYNGSSDVIDSNYGSFATAYGTGDTPPTVDDYQLSGDLISTLTTTNGAINVNANGITFSHSITNTGSTSVTIKEIALCIRASGQYSSPVCVMLTRDVLAEPIVLEPNAQRNISIFIDSNSFVQEVA